MQAAYQITRRLEFDAGHRVPLHASKCKHVHGHRYVVLVNCTARQLTCEGFVIDFGVVKELVGQWIDSNLDHRFLGQLGDIVALQVEAVCLAEGMTSPVFWMEDAPTAENLACLLYKQADNLLASTTVRVTSVQVFETPNCSATYPLPITAAVQEGEPCTE